MHVLYMSFDSFCRTGADPASKVRGEISVRFGSQVS